MQTEAALNGKRILIVDDEPDVLDTLEELLSASLIDKAPDFETGNKFLDKYTYDAAIFDIMGVRGYDLLRIARQKAIPVLMLTAHALNPENLVKSIREGAYSYVPKDKLPEIATYVAEVMQAHRKGTGKHGPWFSRLKPFFDRQFGSGWREKHKKFWDDYEGQGVVGKQDLEQIM